MLCSRRHARALPLWLKLVLRLERAVGGPVEAAVRSDTYFDVVAELNRGHAAADRRGRGRVQARPAPAQPPGRDRHPARARAARAHGPPAAADLEGARAARTSARRGAGLIVALQLSPADLLAASTATSSGRTCARATGCATCAGATARSSARRPRTSSGGATRRSCGATAAAPVRFAQPLLIVTSLVSRSYILDLLPGSSAVEFLRDRGFDVFMLDWGIPDELDADNSLETLRGRVPAARRGGGAPRDRLRGAHDGRLLPRRRALGALRQRSRGRGRAQPRADGDAGRLRGDGPDGGRAARGQARPGATSSTRPATSRPTSSTAASSCSPRRRSWRSGRRCSRTSGTTSSSRGFQAMAQWTRDQVPFPGAAFREVVELFVRRNALMDGSLRVGGREIDFATTGGERAQRDGREGHRRAAGGGRAGRGDWSAARTAAHELRAARRARHVRDRPLGVPPHPAESRRLDRRAQRRGKRER